MYFYYLQKRVPSLWSKLRIIVDDKEQRHRGRDSYLARSQQGLRAWKGQGAGKKKSKCYNRDFSVLAVLISAKEFLPFLYLLHNKLLDSTGNTD